MKVTLDLSRLLQEGAISRVEHDRLLAMGRRDDSLVLVNVLIGFGVIAVAAGAVALIPSAIAGAVLGALLMAAGIAVAQVGPSRWGSSIHHMHPGRLAAAWGGRRAVEPGSCRHG